MRDVDDGIVVAGYGYESAPAKDFDNFANLTFFAAGDGDDFREGRWATGLPVRRSRFDQSLKQPTRNLFTLVFFLNCRQRLVGVAVQRLAHAAHGFVMPNFNGLSLRSFRARFLPGAHEHMLQDRKLVGFVADVVEQPLHQ